MTVPEWYRRNGWKFALILALLAASGVTLYSASMTPRYDRWQYPVWYLSEYLLTTGTLPTCSQVSADMLPVWTGKACLRIGTPGHPVSVATFTALTGLDFTGPFKRWFVFTPLLKLSAGYLLVAQFAKARTSRILGTAIIYLSPDYSTLYLTTAKGLSFSLLLFSVYFLVKTLREDFRWSLLYLLSFVLLLEYYVPRSVLVVVFAAVVAHFLLADRKIVRSLILVYNTVFALYFFQADLFGEYYRIIAGAVEPGLLAAITAERASIPFFEPSSGLGWILLLPLGTLGAVGGLLALREKGVSFLADERMLWLYSLVIGYLPAGLLLPFFRTRLFFEAAIPGLLVAADRCDLESVGRYMRSGVAVSILILVVGYSLTLSGAVGYGPQYDSLADTMTDADVREEEIVFTDMKTGAYLVGENRHLNTTMLTDGGNRERIGAVWYYSDADAACRIMSDRESDYFVLREDVRTQGVPVMNYDRVPAPESALEKYRDSPRYDRVIDAWEFDVYELNAC
ncbi:MAG: hypothetical protein V5A60_12105 [Haloarculaceae archaeon]